MTAVASAAEVNLYTDRQEVFLRIRLPKRLKKKAA